MIVAKRRNYYCITMVKRFQERYEIINNHIPYEIPMRFSKFGYAIKFHYRISGECERKRRKKILKLPSDSLCTIDADAYIIYFFSHISVINYVYLSLLQYFQHHHSILFCIGQCNIKETWNKTGTSGN